MKLKSAIIGLMALTASVSAGAYVYVPDFLSIGCVEIGAEYLYWKPCTKPFDYGLLIFADPDAEGAVPKISFLSRTAGYDSGFRIFGTLTTCSGCSYAGVEWVRLHASTSSVNKNLGTWRIFSLGSSGSALEVESVNAINTRIRHRYDKVNAYWGFHFVGYGCSRLYGYIGARYLSLDRNGLATAQDPENSSNGARKENSRFQGWGAAVGLRFDQDLSCGFELNAKLAATIASGSQKSQYLVRAFDGEIETAAFFEKNLTTTCVPGAEFRLGISYIFECSCLSIKGELGYGIDYYVNALRRYAPPHVTIQSDAGSSSYTQTDFQKIDVAFAGPYAGLSVCF